MKVLVCGGRNYIDVNHMWLVLGRLHHERLFTEIIHGGAAGADSLAARWGQSHGLFVREFPADWKKYGRAAGNVRNTQMLREGNPQLVVAFPGGTGTANMIEQAKRVKIEVIEDHG